MKEKNKRTLYPTVLSTSPSFITITLMFLVKQNTKKQLKKYVFVFFVLKNLLSVAARSWQ